jgi:hypothetical protein
MLAAFGYLALAVGPVLLALLVIGAKFQGLTDGTALDHAQLARHLANGEGFTTYVIRPLSLVLHANLRHHPDMYNAPGHPALLALVFRLTSLTDRVVAGTGAALWVLSVWLTFAVAARWFGSRVAAVATLLYVGNVAALSAAIAGLPYPLATVLVLLTAWLVFRPPAEPAPASAVGPDAGAAPPPVREAAPWRLAAGGVVSAAAVLTDYQLLPFALILVLYLAWTEAHRWRSAGVFGAGFLVGMLPWLWRSTTVGGSPLFNLNWYEALANTNNYPGGWVWRLTELPEHPLRFLLVHPLQTLRKSATGLAAFWREGPAVASPLIGFLFLAAAFSPVGTRTWMREKAAVLLAIAACILAAAPLRADPVLLLDFSPLLCIAAAQALMVWLPQRVGPLTLGQRHVSEAWTRGLAWTGILLLGLFPLLFFVLVARPGPPSHLRERYEALKVQIPPNAKVLTDQPAVLAWYTDRRAIWLPQREEDLDFIEKYFGAVDAAYVSPAIGAVPVDEWGAWWTWVATPQGIYHDLAVVEPGTASSGVLRLRTNLSEGNR